MVESSNNTEQYSDEQHLEEIKRVSKELGKPPTWDEFDRNAEMSTQSVMLRFGSWNEAKERAGVETYAYRSGGEKERLSKAGIYRRAKDTNCKNCNEGFVECLVLHHLSEYEKSFNVSRWSQHSPTKQELRDEIEKCIVLCANCHRKVHSEEHELEVDVIL